MMSSQKPAEPSSPSASSILFPLGRRGSRSSLDTRAEREHLNEALDQIHSAAYQSDSLTVFNEFAQPPSPSTAEQSSAAADPHSGLSGLYSRFRASVGEVKNIVGGSTKSSDAPAVDQSTAKSQNVDSSSRGALDTTSSQPKSGPTSKTQPPAVDNHSVAPGLRGSKLSSKPASISSKASVASTTGPKSPVPTLVSAADPTVAEVTVNAVRTDAPSSGGIPNSGKLQALHGAVSPHVERSEESLQSSLSDLSGGPNSQKSASPVLLGKPYREGQTSLDSSQNWKLESDVAVHEDSRASNQDSSTAASSGLDSQRDGRSGTSTPSFQATLHGSAESNPHLTSESESPVTVSASNSGTKVSSLGSSVQDGRTSTALTSATSLGDRESELGVASKPSDDASAVRHGTRPSQGRLPGYVISRASSNDSAAIPTIATENSSSSSLQHQSSGGPIDSRQNNPSPLRRNLLSKEFWMRDENAKDCFLCGEPFTTFLRRKHHCRTCGQIFDSKCTVLVPGSIFGQSGSIRLCKPCDSMIKANDYDSSDYSDVEQNPPPATAKPMTPELSSNGFGNRGPDDDDDASSIVSQPMEHVLKTPTMAIPATRRKTENGHTRSAVLEIDSDRPQPRPTSSRSVRSSTGLRTYPMGHKRHHSRQQHMRGPKFSHEDRVPFQRRALEDANQGARLSAFHKDNIIDPDLAQYLSDDASSGDEQPSLLAAVSEGPLAKGNSDQEKASFGGLLAAVKKGRPRLGDRSTGYTSPRDPDESSVTSSRGLNIPRTGRRRTHSVASSVHHRASPRASKDGTLLHQDHQNASVASHSTSTQPRSGFKMTRSSSMRGASAPAIELNKVSMEHVRKLLRQLLRDASVPRPNSWETALLPILLRATDDVNPDVQCGDDMDIRHYVKLKKIPGGRPGDTSYVSGLVFTKNLATKSMPRSIPRPNIVIITFPIEYARHQQHFMSLEPVIRQEREFLENLVNRIAALKPNLLLVEKGVSGLALELLEKANIATAYNVKPSVLEAVSRCTQTRIITSMDKLVTTPVQTGHCGSVDLKTYVHNGRRKTYMYISGCPSDLGCTIVLRGADYPVLAKVKRITEFMIYVVYNLKLETCLMRDEFARLPTSEDVLRKDETASNARRLASGDSFTDKRDVPESNTADKPRDNAKGDLSAATMEGEVPDDIPMPTYYEDLVQSHETKILSASPLVKFEPPYLLMRARELERRLAYLKSLRDRCPPVNEGDEKNKSHKFVLITPEMVHESPDDAPEKVREVLHAVHDAEYDRALHNYETQKRQWEAFLSGNSNLFDPYAHQNIVVLYSLVCTTTSIPCSGPDIFALEFYNEHESDDRRFEADCTLGQYVESLCLEAHSVCAANGCENAMINHHRQYVHGEAQISVFVQPYPSKLRGLQDTILMWSCCKICGNETQVMPMSESTWRYSFGKYLELSFWSVNVRARAGVCPHDIHRDHLRFFGFKDMAVRIHYDPINLLEIIVPRTRVTWKVDNDLRLRNEIYKKSEHRINKFMLSVKARLKGINVQSVMPEKVEDCRNKTETLMKKANDDHTSLIKQLQDKYMNSRYWEVTPFNEVLRSVQEKVVEWDNTFAEFEKDFFPSEKDIKRLASLQLRKIFLDRDASATTLTPGEESPTAGQEREAEDTEGKSEKPKPVRRMTLSPEKAQDVLVSVVEEHSNNKTNANTDGAESTEQDPAEKTAEQDATEKTAASDLKRSSTSPPVIGNQGGAEHLDLAVQSSSTQQDEARPQPTTDTDTADVPGAETPTSESSDRLGATPSPDLTDNPDSRQRAPIKARMTPSSTTPSGIPRLAEGGTRSSGKARTPPLLRAQSQPIQTAKDKANGEGPAASVKSGSGNKTPGPLPSPPPQDAKTKFGDKRLSERLGLSALKSGKLAASGHSLIPRSVPGKKSGARVSNLARHFEQLSKEFEKERQRERLQRAAKSKHSRAYPMASSKAIVEVYRNVREAVEEREPSGEGEESPNGKETPPNEGDQPQDESSTRADANASSKATEPEQANQPSTPSEGGSEQPTMTEEATPELEEPPEEPHSDEDQDQNSELVESPEESKLAPEEDIDLKDLPKHERNTLVRMLTNFWAERSSSGWQPLDYPLRVSDHVFADCNIIVREDEPSSLIAFALDSQDYKDKLASIQEHYEKLDEEQGNPDLSPEARYEQRLEQALLRETGTHLKYQWQEGQAKMLCKVFYAEQFDALRRKCGVADRIVESLSRCAKWDSKGGKTKSLFLKTLDDRFVMKSLSHIETQAFLKFAPAYFQIMSEALFHELPSVIAKMFGFYQVIIKNPATGTEFNWFLLVMENLFYDRSPTRIFDLKGSMRNRKVQSTGERDEVLLDENMVDYIYETPLFAREHSKKLLSQSVWNDTLFLGRQNVMDYSLMIAIDEQRHELVVGIIDCIRTYTWDKKLESWIKDRGFAGGGKNRPTVTSPKEYKSRFREAMARYVLQAPK